MGRQIVYLSYSETLDKERILRESETTWFKCFRMYEQVDGTMCMQGTMEELEAYAKENPDRYSVYECSAMTSLDRTYFVWDRAYVKDINTEPKVFLAELDAPQEEITDDFFDEWLKSWGFDVN